MPQNDKGWIPGSDRMSEIISSQTPNLSNSLNCSESLRKVRKMELYSNTHLHDGITVRDANGNNFLNSEGK